MQTVIDLANIFSLRKFPQLCHSSIKRTWIHKTLLVLIVLQSITNLKLLSSISRTWMSLNMHCPHSPPATFPVVVTALSFPKQLMVDRSHFWYLVQFSECSHLCFSCAQAPLSCFFPVTRATSTDH